MFTITRSTARDLRAVFRRLCPGRFGQQLVVELTTGRDGLTARCQTDEVAAEFRQPGSTAEGRILVPLEALTDCAGKDDSAVAFRPDGSGKVEVRWTHAGVPHALEYDAPKKCPEFPASPDRFTPNGPGLLTALEHAAQTVSKDGSRFATQRIQLRGGDGRGRRQRRPAAPGAGRLPLPLARRRPGPGVRRLRRGGVRRQSSRSRSAGPRPTSSCGPVRGPSPCSSTRAGVSPT